MKHDVVTVCKLRCMEKKVGTAIVGGEHDGLTPVNYRFGAVYGAPDDPKPDENAIFGKWTPNAGMACTIYNPNVNEKFEQGKDYYVTFTEADTSGKTF